MEEQVKYNDIPSNFIIGSEFKQLYPEFKGYFAEYDPKQRLYQMFHTNMHTIEDKKYYFIIQGERNEVG